MAINVELIRSSFKLLAPSADRLVERFYEILFKRYPQVIPLFERARMEEQRKMLLRSLAIIVRQLDNKEYLTHYLHGLGRTHVAYGTQPAHYNAVGACLLAAMKEIAGDAWTKELETQWTEAYGAIAALMLEGAGQKPVPA